VAPPVGVDLGRRAEGQHARHVVLLGAGVLVLGVAHRGDHGVEQGQGELGDVLVQVPGDLAGLDVGDLVDAPAATKIIEE
jgi:hypothetical protein